MRKNFKRKNYVLFGAIGIAAVALSSVGFATWITGMQKLTDDDNTITIKVDTFKFFVCKCLCHFVYLTYYLLTTLIYYHNKVTCQPLCLYIACLCRTHNLPPILFRHSMKSH